MNGFLLNTLPPLLLFGLGLAGVTDHGIWDEVYATVLLGGHTFGAWMMFGAVCWLFQRRMP